MRIKKCDILEKIYHTCNLNTEDDDIIYKTMFKYKSITNEPKEVQDAIYNYLANRLGYINKIDNNDIELIKSKGY